MITVKEIKDCNLIEKITIDTLKCFEWIEPYKISIEAYQNTTTPFFAIAHDDIYIGYAILIIHNKYVAELQINKTFKDFSFVNYNEYRLKNRDVSKAVAKACKDYCDLRGMSVLYCPLEEHLM
ncbi:MAG: hypothetical protein HDT21_11275 [Ruminococcus sp.]|nr:hypothetical protein [Ruminococcus sp.]